MDNLCGTQTYSATVDGVVAFDVDGVVAFDIYITLIGVETLGGSSHYSDLPSCRQ